MARGHQKIQSQQKNAKKQAEIKKSKGHDQKSAAKAALVFTCGVCRVSGYYSRLFLPRQIILRGSFQPSFNSHS
uniref:Zinc finger protein 706 n=1 Tax=Cyprinus carpio carpio TaxID=630221 RepID=A0A9J7ZJW1_CYPCA